MAFLQNITTNEIVILKIRHLFGRAQQWVDTHLEHPQVCPIHCAIRFTGQTWQLENLSHPPTQSLHNNAIEYDGQPVDGDNATALLLGGIITFALDKQQQWRVINLDPPIAILHSIQPKDLFIELHQSIDLPQMGAPILQLKQLNNGIWVCNKNQVSAEIKEGAIICAGDEIWQFSTTRLFTATAHNQVCKVDHQQLCFHFMVSQDEEHIRVVFETANTTLDMGEHVHHYPLLLLARKRRDDINSGYDTLSQGWIDVDDFRTALGTDNTVLNMHIYRARRQLNQLLTTEQSIVERRPGQLRFGFVHFKIFCGSKLEL